MINICFCILSGGASSRMGQDKALLKLGNTYLINYIRKTIKDFLEIHDLSQKIPIFLILHQTKQAEKYMDALGDLHKEEIIIDEDVWKGFRPELPIPPNGSIFGLWAAMEFLKNKFDYIFLVPNDRPLITNKMIELLWDKIITKESEESDIDQRKKIIDGLSYIPLWNEKKWEPLFAVYHVQTMVKIFENKVIQNLYSFQKTFQELITETVVTDDLGNRYRVLLESIPIESELIQKDKNFIKNLQDVDSMSDLKKIEEDFPKRGK